MKTLVFMFVISSLWPTFVWATTYDVFNCNLLMIDLETGHSSSQESVVNIERVPLASTLLSQGLKARHGQPTINTHGSMQGNFNITRPGHHSSSIEYQLSYNHSLFESELSLAGEQSICFSVNESFCDLSAQAGVCSHSIGACASTPILVDIDPNTSAPQFDASGLIPLEGLIGDRVSYRVSCDFRESYSN